MYVTRPLSHYKKYPETLSTTPEGPNSGYLVLHDEESETYSCFGLWKNRYLEDLPFPQNKELTIRFEIGGRRAPFDDVLLIPALNQPLSSNRYYAIQPHGKHKGEAFTCSRVEDNQTCCFRLWVRDLKPRPLDPHNVYQQFEISSCMGKGHFLAKSMAPDGIPPLFLRRERWSIRIKTPKNYQLGEAPGLNDSLRGVLPDFNFPVSDKNSKPVLAGKWYCPFAFIKEGSTLRDQMKSSIFYEMTLERKWERIFALQNNYNKGNSVTVDVDLESEIIFLDENKAVRDDGNAAEGFIWFRKVGSNGEAASVGLRVEIVERMKWEQERGGWLVGDDQNNQVRVHKEEKFEGIAGWREFGCYVLVENFVLKRMDGTLVMSYGFRHTHQIKSKWE